MCRGINKNNHNELKHTSEIKAESGTKSNKLTNKESFKCFTLLYSHVDGYGTRYVKITGTQTDNLYLTQTSFVKKVTKKTVEQGYTFSPTVVY